MNVGEEKNGGSGRDEIVAGEYVLGVLSGEARRAAEERMAREPAFAARVHRWESDLAKLNEAYEPVTPPQALLQRIERRVFPEGDRTSAPGAAANHGLWNSLAFWRGASVALLLVVAGMTAMVVEFGGTGSESEARRPLVADLAAASGPINLVARYDRSSGRLQLTPVASASSEPHSLQLWMIQGKHPPVSLGVLPQNGRGDVLVPQEVRREIGAGTVIAVSLEPAGGSPTGAPTGPVLASGPARSL